MRKNKSFLVTQTEKVISDFKLAASREFESFGCVGMKFENPKDYFDFVTFKYSVLEICKKNSIEKLQKILEEQTSLLCKKCQKGLATSEVKCDADFRRMILCEYIKRSLS